MSLKEGRLNCLADRLVSLQVLSSAIHLKVDRRHYLPATLTVSSVVMKAL